MKKKFFAFIAGILMMTGAMYPVGAFADRCASTTFFGLDPWYATLTCTNNEIDQSNFESGKLKDTILGIAGTVTKDLMFIAGFGAVALLVYGGYLFIISQGNPGGLEKAKKTITNAIIGLVIVTVSYGILTFLLKVLGGD